MFMNFLACFELAYGRVEVSERFEMIIEVVCNDHRLQYLFFLDLSHLRMILVTR
jgi:hypothetical protein